MVQGWIAAINKRLDGLGVYPELKAYGVQSSPDIVALVDTRTLTAYHSPEGVYRELSLRSTERYTETLPPAERIAYIYQLLRANRCDDDEARIELQPDGGYLWI